MATQRALAIPEILRAIALHIPLFTFPPLSSTHESRSFYDSNLDDDMSMPDTEEPGFVPHSLLNCCLVCRSWRQVLIPVLWRCFDERFMWRVPQELLVRYRVHFRYFRGRVMPLTRRELEEELDNAEEDDIDEDHEQGDRDTAQQQQDEQQCRSLVQLDVFFFRKSGWGKVVHTVPAPVYARLVRWSRHLKHLRLVTHTAKPQPIDARALLKCLGLRELRMSGFFTTSQLLRAAACAGKEQGMEQEQKKEQGQDQQRGLDQDLGRFLMPVSNTLTHLTLADIRGTYSLPGTGATPIWFPHLIDFTTDLSSGVSPGIEELIARSPNLERLSLCPEPSVSMEPLAAVLRRRQQDDGRSSCCRIKTLRIRTTTNPTNHIHKVIEACGPLLTHLEYKCNILTADIQRSTRAHRHTLETLKISVAHCRGSRLPGVDVTLKMKVGQEQTLFIQEIVDSFLQLRSFTYRDLCQRTLQTEFAETLMQQPWQCRQLEELHVVLELLEPDFVMEYLCPGREFVAGWRVPMDVPVDRMYVRPKYQVFESFLKHVSHDLPRLRKITALRVDCVRVVDDKNWDVLEYTE